MKKYLVILCVVFVNITLAVGCGQKASRQGVEYLENGQYDEALEQFEQAVEDEKNVGDAYRGIGLAKWEKKDYKGAEKALQKALENDTDKTGTLYNLLGSCEMKLEKYGEALSHFSLALEDEDSSKELLREVRLNMIAAYEQQGDIESAKAKLADYVSDYPDDEKAQKEMEFLETR